MVTSQQGLLLNVHPPHHINHPLNSAMKFVKITVIALAASCAPAMQAQIVIDNFSDTFELVNFGVGTQSVTDSGPGSGFIGGRTATVETTDAGFGLVSTTLGAITQPSGDSTLKFSNGTDAIANFNMQYNSLGGLDLTESGLNDTMAIQLVSNDVPGKTYNLRFELTDTFGSSDNVTVGLNSTGFITASLGDFTGVDATSIAEIAFHVEPGSPALGSADMSFDNFITAPVSSVPEPSAYALLTGLVCAAFLIRRRTKRVA
jgi:hypothetical protein